VTIREGGNWEDMMKKVRVRSDARRGRRLVRVLEVGQGGGLERGEGLG